MFPNNKYQPLDDGSTDSNNLKVPHPISGTTNTRKTIDIPTTNSYRNNNIHQSMQSRRSSTIKQIPVVPNNFGKSVDSRVFVSVQSPNFRTSRDDQQEEIINSVRENYLSNAYRKHTNGTNNKENVVESDSATSVTHSTDETPISITEEQESHSKKTDSELDDPSLKSSGGDILRDIYKMTNNTSDLQLKRQKSTEDVLLTMERVRRESTASGLNVPGGFRREFIVKKS